MTCKQIGAPSFISHGKGDVEGEQPKVLRTFLEDHLI